MGLSHPHERKDDKIERFRLGIYGVLLERGRVLLTESRYKAGASFVNFPGGAIKRGEAPALAITREFGEETGLEVRPTRLLWASQGFHRSHHKPTRQLVGIYWAVERSGGALHLGGNSEDVVRAFWAMPEELEGLGFTAFDHEALPAVIDFCRSSQA